MNGRDSEPEFVFSPEFYSSWRSPYTPPSIPLSREEALFLISPGGRYYLGDILELLDAYQEFLKDHDFLGKIAIDDSIHTSDIELTRFDLSCYFSGFSHLGHWLFNVCSQIGAQPIPNGLWSERCLNIPWMAEFAQDTAAQGEISIIESLRDSLRRVSDFANRLWHSDVYWDMVLERLKAAASANEAMYAGRPVHKDRNSREDRAKLHKSMQEDGVFNVQFYCYFSEDECEPVPKKYYQYDINGFENLLLSTSSMTIMEVYNAICKEPRQCWSTADIQPQAKIPASPRTECLESKTENQADKRGEQAESNKNAPITSSYNERWNLTEDQTIAHENNKNSLSVLLLKFAIHSYGKGYKVSAKDVRSASFGSKKKFKALIVHLRKLTSDTISKAKSSMKLEGFQFVRSYLLTDESYDRLSDELDIEGKTYKATIETKLATDKQEDEPNQMKRR